MRPQRQAAVALVAAVAGWIAGGPAAARAADAVAESYAWVGHRRTPFEPAAAESIPAPERRALATLFTLTDEALVERVQAFRWLRSERREGAWSSGYDAVTSRLRRLSLEGELAEVRDEVLAAVGHQRAFLEAWKSAMDRGAVFREDLSAGAPVHPDVRAASERLHRAYQLLVARYPGAGEVTRQAFFDHLCALDFL